MLLEQIDEMEPELFSLARRLFTAWWAQMDRDRLLEDPEGVWEAESNAEWSAWCAAASVIDLGPDASPPTALQLAARMASAYAFRLDEARGVTTTPTWGQFGEEEQRCWLAAVIEVSPELAEGLTVPAGHWASGILEVTR